MLNSDVFFAINEKKKIVFKMPVDLLLQDFLNNFQENFVIFDITQRQIFEHLRLVLVFLTLILIV